MEVPNIVTTTSTSLLQTKTSSFESSEKLHGRNFKSLEWYPMTSGGSHNTMNQVIKVILMK